MLRRAPVLMGAPAVVLSVALAIHVAGRIAAFCSPHKVDSYTYAVAAYKFWSPGSTAADLVPDKPAGQALLTGWCYRVLPGSPSRLTLVLIESFFLLGGAAMFGWLACRLVGRRWAAALTFFFVLATNAYNALDLTTDGFDLNECYLALPMLTAVFAHLAITRAGWRGLLRGLGIGLALTIKQSAIGLLVVFVLHGLVVAAVRKRWVECAWAAAASLAGIALAWAPLAIFLHYRGWLLPHLHTLCERSVGHLASPGAAVRHWDVLLPLAPVLWWIALGLLAWRMASPASADAATSPRRSSEAGFVALWLAVEVSILCAMSKPATHYYQQIVAPAALAAGLAMDRLARSLTAVGHRDRAAVWRWVFAGTVTLATVSAMPLLAESFKRVRTFDYQTECDEFREHVQTWDPGRMGLRVLPGKTDAGP